MKITPFKIHLRMTVLTVLSDLIGNGKVFSLKNGMVKF